MSLPADLRVPFLAAASPVARAPKPDALPGGCLYEPKWDGFRISASVTDTVTLWSRQNDEVDMLPQSRWLSGRLNAR